MTLGPQKIWLTGESVRPWIMDVRFSQSSFPNKLIYKYSFSNETSDEVVWEREPSRCLEILEPSSYKPELNTDGIWRNVNQVYLVNGHIEKIDANFVGTMKFDKIGDTPISIGPYP